MSRRTRIGYNAFANGTQIAFID